MRDKRGRMSSRIGNFYISQGYTYYIRTCLFKIVFQILKGLFKRIDSRREVETVGTTEELERYVAPRVEIT